MRGHAAFIRILLDYGARLENVDHKGRTPLHAASRNGHTAVVDILIGKGVGVDRGDHDGKTPLHYAVRGGHRVGRVEKYIEIIRKLIAHGAVVDQRDKTFMTPLHHACYETYHYRVILWQFFMYDLNYDSYYYLNYDSYYYEWALRHYRNHMEIIQLLIDEGADVDPLDKLSSTPLHYAARGGHTDIVRLLIQHGADVNYEDASGQTPLHTACTSLEDENPNIDAIQLLIDAGTDLDRGDHRGRGPLHIASHRGHTDVVRRLLDGGAIVDYENQYNGETPLHEASAAGCTDVVRLLASRCANVNHVDQNNDTPLNVACLRRRRDVVNNLLRYRAKMKPQGEPLLSEATSATIARLLLKSGAATGTDDHANFFLREFQTRRSIGADGRQVRVPTTKAKAQGRQHPAPTKAKAKAPRRPPRMGGRPTPMSTIRGLEAQLATLKADHAAELAATTGELQRWRDGELICKQVLAVDTGTVTTTTVDVTQQDDGIPRRKRPRQDTSALAHLVQVKVEAVEEKVRLQGELEATTLCSLCMENPRDMYFAGCGHCLACGPCATRLIAQHGGTRSRTKAPCPVCRQPIQRVLPFKLA